MNIKLWFPWHLCGHNNASINHLPHLHRWPYTVHRRHYSTIGWFYALNNLSSHLTASAYKNTCMYSHSWNFPVWNILRFSSFKTQQQASKHMNVFLQSEMVSPCSPAVWWRVQYQLPLPPASVPFELYFKVTWVLSLHRYLLLETHYID